MTDPTKEALDAEFKRITQAWEAPGTEALMRDANALALKLHSRCFDLACDKGTDGSPLAFHHERQLRRMVELAGPHLHPVLYDWFVRPRE